MGRSNMKGLLIIATIVGFSSIALLQGVAGVDPVPDGAAYVYAPGSGCSRNLLLFSGSDVFVYDRVNPWKPDKGTDKIVAFSTLFPSSSHTGSQVRTAFDSDNGKKLTIVFTDGSHEMYEGSSDGVSFDSLSTQDSGFCDFNTVKAVVYRWKNEYICINDDQSISHSSKGRLPNWTALIQLLKAAKDIDGHSSYAYRSGLYLYDEEGKTYQHKVLLFNSKTPTEAILIAHNGQSSYWGGLKSAGSFFRPLLPGQA